MKTTDRTLRNKVIYQIFTRNYKEGSFSAVEKDLDRIKSLGVDYIYLLPIHPSGKVNRKGSMGSPYAISDYRAVDPVQGSKNDFIQLSNAVHEKGMGLIIDIVYNHTSPDSILAQNHSEWFYHKEDGSLGNRIGDWWDVVDLDYTNKELWDYQIDTLKMWAEYVDGFRCDVAPMVPLDFWLEARRQVEEVRPGCIWIAEAVEPFFIRNNRLAGVYTLTDSELYNAFDICYDYDIYNYMKDAMTGDGSLFEYTRAMDMQETMYPENYIKLRCLENHDRPRAAALVPDNSTLVNWTAFNYFAKGIVMLYAGQEYCVQHHPTLFDLDTVDFNTGRDISGELYKLSVIKRNPIFSEGIYSVNTIGTKDEIIYAEYKAAAGSGLKNKRALGIFSVTGTKQAVTVNIEDGRYINEYNGKEIDVYEKTVCFDGDPIIFII